MKRLFAPVLLWAMAGAQTAANPPEVAPGLALPSGSIPYALDHYEGKAELVPIHHSNVEVNAHKGANVAGELAGSFFYKPKTTIELTGEHARSVVHDLQPAIFVHVMDDPDGDDPKTSAEFAIVRATAGKDKRVFSEIRQTQLTGNAKRKDGSVDTRTEALGGGWLKIRPIAPLAPGEYGFMSVPKNQNTFSTVIFDFAVTPDAPNAGDAVLAKTAE